MSSLLTVNLGGRGKLLFNQKAKEKYRHTTKGTSAPLHFLYMQMTIFDHVASSTDWYFDHPTTIRYDELALLMAYHSSEQFHLRISDLKEHFSYFKQFENESPHFL